MPRNASWNPRFAMKPPLPIRHRAAITTAERLGDLLRACDEHGGTGVVRAALKPAPTVQVLAPGACGTARGLESKRGAGGSQARA